MERLTDRLQFPLTTFKRCQLCGFKSQDICEFRMYVECDELDQPEPEHILILCRQKSCQHTMDSHPRLYREIPWGQGHPGIFMLLCGNCQYRDNLNCKHPALKSNGGDGLEVKFSQYLQVTVCFSDGRCRNPGTAPATFCAGQKAI